MFQSQGRLGPAVGALQDAVNGLRSAGEKGATMASALSALADALARAGRGAEAGKYLDEAKTLAPGLKSDAVDGVILNTEGDLKFYQGDTRSAAALYEQAARLASKSSNTDLTLSSKLNIDKVAVAEGRSRAAITDLRTLAQKADEQGRRILAVEASVLMAEGMLKDKDVTHGRQELERSLTRSEKLGLRLQQSKIHYLLGTADRTSGNATEAAAHFRTAVNLLDQVQKEAGAEHILDRSDLKTMYADASQSIQKN
jgi:tetratricopeptide (TPR) repeat protein